MKKYIVSLVLICLVIIGLIIFKTVPQQNTEFVRIHIRANSNLSSDQSIKLDVRDAVINYLIPHLAVANTADEAKQIIFKECDTLAKIADEILSSRGYTYGANAKLTKESFPARTYGDLTLASGTYDALILNLGTGEGDNWWCVAFPPLCFVPAETSDKVVYKSKILEIIKKFKARSQDA